MADLILYSYYRSTCSYRVRIALELKLLPYEYRSVHLIREGGEQKREDYLRLNPMGQVPALVHSGQTLAQSMAIIEFLDALYPEPALFPKDPYLLARTRQLCENINSGIQPLQNLGVLQQLEAQFGADEQGKADWVRHWIGKGFLALERELASCAGLFSVGDQPSAADCFLVPQVFNAMRYQLPLADFPTIAAIHSRCLALPAFQKADPAVQPDAPT